MRPRALNSALSLPIQTVLLSPPLLDEKMRDEGFEVGIGAGFGFGLSLVICTFNKMPSLPPPFLDP